MATFKLNKAQWNSLLNATHHATSLAADRVKEDIRAHWSPAPAPSMDGASPAYDTDINTGDLDASITVEDITKSKYAPTFLIGPTQDIEYAAYLEDGTAHMASRPFIAPARPRAKEILIEELRVIWRGL